MAATIGTVPVPNLTNNNISEVVRKLKINVDALTGQLNPASRALTTVDLTGGLIASAGGGGGGGGGAPIIIPGGGSGYDPYTDTTTPPPPTGLVATGAYSTVLLSWDPEPVTFKNLAYTEIFVSATELRSGAVLLTRTTGSVYSHEVGAGQTRYYWIRYVSLANVTGPDNATLGTPATTAIDVGAVIDALSGQISESELNLTLNERINLVDAPTTGLVSRTTVLELATSAIASDVTTLVARVEGYSANLLANSSFETDSDADGMADRWAVYWGTAPTGLSHSLDASRFTHGAKSQKVSATTVVDAIGVVQDAYVPIPTNAAGTPYSAAVQVAGTAGKTAVLNIGFYDGSNVFVTSASASVVLIGEGTFQQIKLAIPSMPSGVAKALVYAWNVAPGVAATQTVDAFQFQAGELTGYSLSDVAPAVAALEIASGVSASQITGLSGQYSVKLDLNGYVSGFGLSSTAPNTGDASSLFLVKASRFAVGSPGQSGIYPFIVQTDPTTINGVAVPAGVYMDTAFIRNGTITNVKIGDAQIDSAKISTVTAAKISTGTLEASVSISSNNYSAGVSGWNISGTGAEFPFAYIRGTLLASQIAAGSIDATKIDSRGLTIKDGAGNVIFAAGTPLTEAYAAAELKNSTLVPSIASAATTASWSGVTGTGRPADYAGNVIDGQRTTNPQPQTYAPQEVFYFKEASAIGFTTAYGTLGVLRTVRPYGPAGTPDLTGGAVNQWFEINGLVGFRRSVSATSWGAWEMVPNGTINSSNVSTYIASAAIGAAQIGSLNVGVISTAINGGSTARVQIDTNLIRVYDASNIERIRMGVW